jgi:hypothetical protein
MPNIVAPDESTTEPRRVPDKVKHADFLAAIQPLLTLCGVSNTEILRSVHIGPSELASGLTQIDFLVIARAAEDHGEFPTAVVSADGMAPPPQDVPLVFPVTVTVI